MNLKQRSGVVNFLFVGFFILQLLSFFLYVPCDSYVELIENNGHVFKIEKLSYFVVFLGAFLMSSGSNKAVFRVLFVAMTYSTINEFTELNNYLYYLEYPVFWSIIVLTALYSYAKYKK